METIRTDLYGKETLDRAPVTTAEYNRLARMMGVRTRVDPDGTKVATVSNEQYDGVLHNRAARRRAQRDARKAAKKASRLKMK